VNSGVTLWLIKYISHTVTGHSTDCGATLWLRLVPISLTHLAYWTLNWLWLHAVQNSLVILVHSLNWRRTIFWSKPVSHHYPVFSYQLPSLELPYLRVKQIFLNTFLSENSTIKPCASVRWLRTCVVMLLASSYPSSHPVCLVPNGWLSTQPVQQWCQVSMRGGGAGAMTQYPACILTSG